MELLGHNFYVFFNLETEEVNVVYKRKGNTYGLIEPILEGYSVKIDFLHANLCLQSQVSKGAGKNRYCMIFRDDLIQIRTG